MLVLSRRVGEEIVIGDNVRIKVVAASGNKVRLAVCAPKSVRVDRLEVNQRRAEFANLSDDARGQSTASFPLVSHHCSSVFARNGIQSIEHDQI